MSRVTRSMTRKKKQDEALENERGIVKTIEEAVERSKESLSNFIRRVKPDKKPTMVPDDFGDFDEASGMQDDWELSEGSDWEDMDAEDAMMEDIATMSDMSELRF